MLYERPEACTKKRVQRTHGIFSISDLSNPNKRDPISRAPHFTEEEQTIILDKYEEVKHIIQTKSNTVEAAKCRKDSWQKKKLPMKWTRKFD